MLTEEQQEQMLSRLQGNSEEVEPEVQVEAFEPEAEETVEEEPSVEASEVEDEEEESGHAVPYSRFRKVNERRKNLQSEIETRDRRLEELQAQLNQRYQQAERPREEFDIEEEEDDDPDNWTSRFTKVEKQNQDMQVRLAHMDLQREIAETVKEFPNVPESYMWDMIAQNGNISAQQAAEQYNSFVSEVEEAAIARYLSTQKAEAAPSAPPRPSTKQTTGTSQLAQPLAPQSMDEAREAMIMYLNAE